MAPAPAAPSDPSSGAEASGRRRRRHLAWGLFLFLAGLGFGMLAARFGWPPYAQLDRLHERYLVDNPAFGPTPRSLYLTDPRRLIDLRSAEDVARRRAELVRFLWGARGLPAGPPQRIERGFRDERFDGMPGLARVDRLVTRLEFGLLSYGFHMVPRRPNGAAVIYHHGHTTGSPRDRQRIARLLGEGYAVVELYMLLAPPNNRPVLDLPRIGRFHFTQHEHLRLLSPAQGHQIGYFIEPVIRVVNYLEPGHDRIAIMGYSGGGWASLLSAAADPRLRSSFVVASEYPFYVLSGGNLGEFESSDPALYRLATHLELMVMAASGEGRQAVQILNRYDPCCFAGRRAETYAPAVRRAVRAIGPGSFSAFIDESEREHGISRRAMDLILVRLGEMR